MVVCKFFLQGNCKFGDGCRNEHPRSQTAQNRFAPLQNPGGGRGRSGAFGQNASTPDQYGITTEEIKADLTHINHDGNRPEWPLSAYAPGRNPPRQLIEGPLELSPEEMRVHCYLARATGKGDEYIRQEGALLQQAQQQAQTILNDVQAAKNYVIEGRNQHPNRIDMEVKPTQNFPWVNKPNMNQLSQTQTGGFGQPSAFGGGGGNTTGGFGQPSSLSAPKSAFGAPTTMGQGSAFGQSSALGGGGGSAFGQASQLGGAGGFGQGSKLGGGSAFGQASTVGASSSPFGGAQKPAAFGQASQPSGGFGQTSQPAFGQSAFGAAAAAKPAFGAPTQPSAFGQPSQQTSSPFGQLAQPSAFGGNTQQTGGSAFGQPSAFGASKPSPFATAAQNTQQSQPQTGGSAFGQPSAFGASKLSPFATAAQQGQQANGQSSSPFAQQGTGFGAASQPASSGPFAAANQNNTTSPFGAPTQPAAQSGFGAASKPTSGFGTTSTTTQKTLPTTWKNHRVLQTPTPTGTLTYYELPPKPGKNEPQRVRIWFPTGPPDAKFDAAYAEAAEPGVYEGQLGETLRGLYEFVAREGSFKEGVMPEVPPRREWVGWDI